MRSIYASTNNGLQHSTLNGKLKPGPAVVTASPSVSFNNGHSNGNGYATETNNKHSSFFYEHPWLSLGLNGCNTTMPPPADDVDDLLAGDPVVISGLGKYEDSVAFKLWLRNMQLVDSQAMLAHRTISGKCSCKSDLGSVPSQNYASTLTASITPMGASPEP